MIVFTQSRRRLRVAQDGVHGVQSSGGVQQPHVHRSPADLPRGMQSVHELVPPQPHPVPPHVPPHAQYDGWPQSGVVPFIAPTAARRRAADEVATYDSDELAAAARTIDVLPLRQPQPPVRTGARGGGAEAMAGVSGAIAA